LKTFLFLLLGLRKMHFRTLAKICLFTTLAVPCFAEYPSDRPAPQQRIDPGLHLIAAGLDGGTSPSGAESQGKSLEAGDVFRDCPKCPDMVVVPAGSFRMGDLSGARDRNAKPVRRVTIPRAFAVGKYEVTFTQWHLCVSAGACRHRPDDRGWGRGSRPVTDVSWEDAKAFTGWLSRRTGATYRLLTEAEWEYVARAGSETRYPWGHKLGNNQANCDGCGSPWDGKKTAPVGQFKPNKFGVYDIVGNVWEWVEDCWHKKYVGAPTDGTAWMGTERECSRRVLRGGSWYLEPWYARTAVRDWNKTNVRSGNFGFRIAKTLYK
jgi:formylglycine-generating enzyme required for sulfatase activity